MKYSWLYALSVCFVGGVLMSSAATAAPAGSNPGGDPAADAAPGMETRTPASATPASKLAAADINNDQAMEPIRPAMKPGNRKASYLVIGSFRRMGDADRLAANLSEVPAAVTPAVVEENVFFRVVTGPFTGDEMTAMRERFTASGIVDPWAINLCTADLSAPPCIAP